MQPGEFEFGTNQKEHMELLAGEWQVLLPGETEWQAMKAGDSFNVDANVTFRVKVTDFLIIVARTLNEQLITFL